MAAVLQQDATEKQVPLSCASLMKQESDFDATLSLAFGSGASWSIELLYQRYSRLLYTMAYRKVANHQIAEDLLQETFITLWKHASSYSSQSGAIQNWLLTIHRNQIIDYLRRVQRQSTLKQVTWEEAEQDESITTPDVWEETWQTIRKSYIRIALRQLPVEQQRVLELTYFQGWTQSEIAQTYHIPPGTVKTRLRLGVRHLRRTLEHMGISEV